MLKKQCQFCINRGKELDSLIPLYNPDGSVYSYTDVARLFDITYCKEYNTKTNAFFSCDKFSLDKDFINKIIIYFDKRECLEMYKDV